VSGFAGQSFFTGLGDSVVKKSASRKRGGFAASAFGFVLCVAWLTLGGSELFTKRAKYLAAW
jgi:hypothetical protein